MRLQLLRLLPIIWLSAVGAVDTRARDLTQDLPGSRDPPGIPRFGDSIIIGFWHGERDGSQLPAGRWDESRERPFWEDSIELEGRRTRLVYLAPVDASSREVMSHYQARLEGLGYEALFQCAGFQECGEGVADFYADEVHGRRRTDGHLLKYVYSSNSVQEPRIHVGRLQRSEGDDYVFVFAAFQDNYADSQAGNRVAVFLEQMVVTPTDAPMGPLDADELARRITEEGRVALHGIQFDPGRSSLGGESRKQLEQLARMLSERPDLEVYIVGHTDNAGGLEYTMSLSRRRAEEVVDTLIRSYGILGERLTPMGVGCLVPLASNATAAGRARNRRLEMVPK